MVGCKLSFPAERADPVAVMTSAFIMAVGALSLAFSAGLQVMPPPTALLC